MKKHISIAILFVLLVVLMGLLAGCAKSAVNPILTPRFTENINTAKNMTQQKTCFSLQRSVDAARQVHEADSGGVTAFPNWRSLMAALVPNVLHSEPKCPAGGVYSLNAAGVISCSVHGSSSN